jgi:hypothetical protein
MPARTTKLTPLPLAGRVERKRKREIMSEESNVKCGAAVAGAAQGSVTHLKCDHIGWGMNAVLMTPAVAIMCGASVAWPPAQFLAGCALGVWLSMWLVVLWAWLTRRQSPNEKSSESGGRTPANSQNENR